MTGVYLKNDTSYDFRFYTDLSYVDKLKFVNSVVSILVGDENYNSIIKDLVFDFYIIDIFSDIDTSELKKSDFFVDDVEKFLEETNIVNVIKANIKNGLIDELNKAINLSIEYRTGIHINPLNDAISNLINTIEKKINEVDTSSMMEMANVFSGMTGEITPESIVNAYLKSDVHKKNLAEIEEEKKDKKNKKPTKSKINK